MEYQFESLGPALRIVVLIVLIVFALLAIGVIVLIAALPGKLAKSRNHPQAVAINVCGWLGLPTGVLWVLAMVWAFLQTGPAGTSRPPSFPDAGNPGEQISALERAVSLLESQSREARQ
jgi:hypothetical protein